jgi:hypothetical protein
VNGSLEHCRPGPTGRHAGGRASEMPCVHEITHGPESAGDDAALIQRKASFDTRRADRMPMMPGDGFPERSSAQGQHLPDAHGRELPTWWMEPDGEAGGRDPPGREFDSPHSPWVSRPAAAVSNPACARSNRVGGTSPVMLGWLSARFVRGSARVRHSPPALCTQAVGPIWRTI